MGPWFFTSKTGNTKIPNSQVQVADSPGLIYRASWVHYTGLHMYWVPARIPTPVEECHPNPPDGDAQWPLLNCFRFPTKALFSPLLPERSDFQKWLFDACSETRREFPSLLLPFNSRFVLGAVTQQPLSAVCLQLHCPQRRAYLFISAGRGWDARRSALFWHPCRHCSEESSPCRRGALLTLVLLPSSWCITTVILDLPACVLQVRRQRF